MKPKREYRQKGEGEDFRGRGRGYRGRGNRGARGGTYKRKDNGDDEGFMQI